MGAFAIAAVLLLTLSWSDAHAYSTSCPAAEWIIRETVKKYYEQDKTIIPGVVRLLYHDCFVNGCDGSILLESNPDGSATERLAGANKNSARGFEVINEAKQRLEVACPGVFSCADTLAMAARDSSVLLGGAYYQVPTGRYDGRFSSKDLADNLPRPTEELEELVKKFKERGLSQEDLVLLTGGHTIGTSKCTFFQKRLYDFEDGKPDPSLNPSYRAQLQEFCPQAGDPAASKVELDRGSRFRFDNSYYKNLVEGNGLLTSDQTLNGPLVQALAGDASFFQKSFAEAMIRLGSIAWKTKENGEIRRQCHVVNS